MIYVFEGPTGAGKTTAARSLAARLQCPLYRPFRPNTDTHNPGDAYPELKLIPMQVNTWREDLAAADVLANIRNIDVVMDRSLPSGVAYDATLWGGRAPIDVGDGPWGDESYGLECRTPYITDEGMAALGLWEKLMRHAGSIIIHVDCSEGVRQSRGARTASWEPRAIKETLRHITSIKRIMSFNECTQTIVDRAIDAGWHVKPI